MATGTLTVHLYSVLARFLIDEFAISRAQLGLLISIVTLVAAILSLPAGGAVDRVGGHRTVLMVFALSLVTLGLIAIGPDYAFLLAASVTGGAMNALVNPSTNKLLVEGVDRARRGVPMGLKMAGVPGGVLLAGFCLPPLAIALGWRAAVAAFALLPLAGALLSGRYRRSGGGGPRAAGSENFHYPATTRLLAAYGLFMGTGMGVVIAFLPLYAEEVVGLTVASAGFAVGVAGVVGLVARIMWSAWSSSADDFGPRLQVLALLSALSGTLIAAAAAVGPLLLWTGAVLTGSSIGAWNAVASLAAVGQVGVRDSGRATGLLFLGVMAGISLSPVLAGAVIDATDDYGLAWAISIIAFVFAAALARPAGRTSRQP